MLNSKGEIDMKKVLSVVLAVMMLALIAVPSFAATVTTAGATDVIVKTSTAKEDGTSGEKYSIEIPADTVIPWGTEATDVSYTVEAHLARNKGVKVVVAGTGEMKTTDGAYSLAYALKVLMISLQPHPLFMMRQQIQALSRTSRLKSTA